MNENPYEAPQSPNPASEVPTNLKDLSLPELRELYRQTSDIRNLCEFWFLGAFLLVCLGITRVNFLMLPNTIDRILPLAFIATAFHVIAILGIALRTDFGRILENIIIFSSLISFSSGAFLAVVKFNQWGQFSDMVYWFFWLVFLLAGAYLSAFCVSSILRGRVLSLPRRYTHKEVKAAYKAAQKRP